MVFTDISGALGSAQVLKYPADYLLFGFNVPLSGFNYALSGVGEPGSGATVKTTVKQSAPYAITMKNATKAVFDSSTSVSGILVMMKTDERVIATWDGTVGHTVTYKLPKNAILLRDTSGHLNNAGTCPKVFTMGKLKYTIPAGGASNINAIDFESAGFVTRAFSTGISRALLAQRGFITASGKLAFRLAFIPCGVGSCDVVNLHPNSAAVADPPVNTFAISFSTPGTVDYKIILEYSGPDNQWKPLSYVDTTHGFTQAGKIHFEPPSDWVETTRWDGQVDIKGGVHGTGPKSRWIRIQRRLPDPTIAGVTLGSLAAKNLPYLVVTRVDNQVSLTYQKRNVGQTVTFRFVPISADGVDQIDAALMFNHKIAGTAFA